MAAFDQTYTDAQIAGVIDYAVKHGNAAEATRKANAGTLPGDLGAFPISYVYVTELVKEERERLTTGGRAARVSKRGPVTIEELTKRLLRLEDKALTRIEKEARTKPRDAGKTLQVARNLAAIATIEGKREGKAPANPNGAKQTKDNLLGRLAAQTAQEGQERPLPEDIGEGPSEGGEGQQHTDTGSSNGLRNTVTTAQ